MCGFVGFTGKQENKKTIIEKMSELIAHRGPDGEGYFIDDGVTLGHRRLAILDIEGGKQPMVSEDKNIVVVFNGEIYNFLEIRKELEEKGHIFMTDHSDTEVLIHGFKEWGEELVPKLRGMFAFAIWNTQTQELFCARDHFGIKPFYYYVTKNSNLLFGSEIKSFLAHDEFKKELNEKQLELYLAFQYSPGEETFFKGVKKLMPAHHMAFKNGILDVKRYWTPVIEDYNAKDANVSIDDAENIMKNSVEAHKISDVEIGSYLSSGIDSSYVTKLSGAQKTFTIGYKNPKYDESVYAQAFSKTLDKENYTRYIEADEYWETIPKAQYHMDEPLADASAVSLYFLNQEAAKKVKVCFSGEGADELFGGYNVYKDAYKFGWYKSLPQFFHKLVLATFGKMPKMRGINFLVRQSTPLHERYFGCTGVCSQAEVRKFLKSYKGDVKPQNFTKKFFESNTKMHEASKMQLVDINMWLIGDILLKADKMSMANSLELRVPFLDMEVFEVARKLPISQKNNSETTKITLRKAAARNINLDVANKKKLGFPVPVRDWLREERFANEVKKAFYSENADKFFNKNEISKLLDDHMNGKRDNWRQVWCIYIFLVWYEVYFCDN